MQNIHIFDKNQFSGFRMKGITQLCLYNGHAGAIPT